MEAGTSQSWTSCSAVGQDGSSGPLRPRGSGVLSSPALTWQHGHRLHTHAHPNLFLTMFGVQIQRGDQEALVHWRGRGWCGRKPDTGWVLVSCYWTGWGVKKAENEVSAEFLVGALRQTVQARYRERDSLGHRGRCLLEGSFLEMPQSSAAKGTFFRTHIALHCINPWSDYSPHIPGVNLRPAGHTGVQGKTPLLSADASPTAAAPSSSTPAQLGHEQGRCSRRDEHQLLQAFPQETQNTLMLCRKLLLTCI